MDLGLRGKRGIVVGGSRGIGRAIAFELAREGVELVIAARNIDTLNRTAEEIRVETGQQVTALPCDVSSRDQVDAMVDAAALQMGGVHILINSGSAPGGSTTATGYIDTIVDEDFLSDFDVKYVGALRCARACIPHMQAARWGRIVNISGLNARIAGNLSGGARNTSLVHFTKTLSNQLGRDGITVNCVHPGLTRTETVTQMFQAGADRQGITLEEYEINNYSKGGAFANSIGRMVDASEVADLTTFLCSDRAWSITGEVIAAGGGVDSSVYY